MESMTGFGSFSGQQGFSWTWTLRSVNNKGLDIRCRCPQGYEELELKIRECIRSFFTRGSISVSLEITADPVNQKPQVNIAFLDELCSLSEQLHKKFPALEAARIDGLLNVHGVVQTDSLEKAEQEEMKRLFLSSLEEAAETLKKSRLEEGAKIALCLKDQIDQIERLVNEAKTFAAAQPQRIKEKLKEMLALIKEENLPEDRFMQEVTACMIRVDVREELDRLCAHVHTARDLFQQKGSIGRKLDFLCQEFNREANTLCSKSADIDLTRTGMALKTVIDQLREQIQNIE